VFGLWTCLELLLGPQAEGYHYVLAALPAIVAWEAGSRPARALVLLALPLLLLDLNYHSPELSGGWRSLLAYPRVWGAVLLFMAASIPILLFRHSIFSNWIGSEHYLGDKILYLFVAHQLIAVHHSAHASASLATKGNAFAAVSSLNVLLVIALILILPQFLGILGLPLAMIIGTVPSSMWIVKYAWQTFYNRNGAPVMAF
jgi:hypothetical protein